MSNSFEDGFVEEKFLNREELKVGTAVSLPDGKMPGVVVTSDENGISIQYDGVKDGNPTEYDWEFAPELILKK